MHFGCRIGRRRVTHHMSPLSPKSKPATSPCSQADDDDDANDDDDDGAAKDAGNDGDAENDNGDFAFTSAQW